MAKKQIILTGLKLFKIAKQKTLFAARGAILFLISDAMLAWNRFRMKFKSAQFLILGTYYVAQWALAMSLGQPNVYYLS